MEEEGGGAEPRRSPVAEVAAVVVAVARRGGAGAAAAAAWRARSSTAPRAPGAARPSWTARRSAWWRWAGAEAARRATVAVGTRSMEEAGVVELAARGQGSTHGRGRCRRRVRTRACPAAARPGRPSSESSGSGGGLVAGLMVCPGEGGFDAPLHESDEGAARRRAPVDGHGRRAKPCAAAWRAAWVR